MNMDMLSFDKVKVNKNLLDEIWAFDPKSIEQVDGAKISTYTIALAQYLIYYKSQYNKTKVDVFSKKRALEAGVGYSISKELLNKYKTKSAVANVIIMESIELSKIQESINKLEDELKLIEGMDKYISEYIAVFKRELTRRENEMYQIRKGNS